MEWEKPEFSEISLACEVSSYANAELNGAVDEIQSDTGSERK
ncbi:MAG TPA: pyrroloquinoline quinone precursor peptide PqqA [Candidatus Acidoferrum sp.]|nr:pyrroloquinoline quinone precursor peptide PqqA [Candidatus Acidoferrum sp.]